MRLRLSRTAVLLTVVCLVALAGTAFVLHHGGWLEDFPLFGDRDAQRCIKLNERLLEVPGLLVNSDRYIVFKTSFPGIFYYRGLEDLLERPGEPSYCITIADMVNSEWDCLEQLDRVYAIPMKPDPASQVFRVALADGEWFYGGAENFYGEMLIVVATEETTDLRMYKEGGVVTTYSGLFAEMPARGYSDFMFEPASGLEFPRGYWEIYTDGCVVMPSGRLFYVYNYPRDMLLEVMQGEVRKFRLDQLTIENALGETGWRVGECMIACSVGTLYVGLVNESNTSIVVAEVKIREHQDVDLTPVVVFDIHDDEDFRSHRTGNLAVWEGTVVLTTMLYMYTAPLRSPQGAAPGVLRPPLAADHTP